MRYLDLMDGGSKTLKEREEARKALEQEQRKRLEEWGETERGQKIRSLNYEGHASMK